MTVKLFGDENESNREKVKLLKKGISEEEQRNTDLNSMVRFCFVFSMYILCVLDFLLLHHTTDEDLCIRERELWWQRGQTSSIWVRGQRASF